MVDVGDSVYEVKTEFYTREGIWRLVPNCEYIRQLQQQQQQASPQYQQQQQQQPGSVSMNGGAGMANSSQQQSMGQSSYVANSNDPCKIGIFKYSKRTIYNLQAEERAKIRADSRRTRLVCSHCDKEQSEDEYSSSLGNSKTFCGDNNNEDSGEHDDDEDVVFTKFKTFDSEDSSDFDDEYDDDDYSDTQNTNTNTNSNEQKQTSLVCKYCKHVLIKSATSQSGQLVKSNVNNMSANVLSLDLMLFNYAREIYFYEFNSVRAKVGHAHCQ